MHSTVKCSHSLPLNMVYYCSASAAAHTVAGHSHCARCVGGGWGGACTYVQRMHTWQLQYLCEMHVSDSTYRLASPVIFQVQNVAVNSVPDIHCRWPCWTLRSHKNNQSCTCIMICRASLHTINIHSMQNLSSQHSSHNNHYC